MGAKILIVDDRADVATAIGRMLRDYETTIETDARRAVARVIGGERFDVVLCDLEMPEMSGREVYKAFRGATRPPAMVMMSGRVDEEPIGAPVLLKPFKGSELRSLISTLLSEGAEVAA